MELDYDYIRRVGEEVRAALFPREREDGQRPTSMPASLRYRLPDETDVDVRFVPLRTYQWIDEESGGAPDVSLSTVDVTFMGHYVGEVDLAFGHEFGDNVEDQYQVREDPDAELDEALMQLLRAVTGTLEEE